MNAYQIIAWTGTALLVGVSFLLAEAGSTYRWSFLFLAPLLWALYFLRHRLALLPFHFALFVMAVLLHDLGSMGFYDKVFVAFRFDSYVHFVFGFVAGLILYRVLRVRLRLTPGALWVAVPLLILGFGGIHELIECASTLVLGPERGMLKMRPGEPFDTQKDLFNNLLGALLATFCYAVKPAVRQSGSRAQTLQPESMEAKPARISAEKSRRSRRRVGSAAA